MGDVSLVKAKALLQIVTREIAYSPACHLLKAQSRLKGISGNTVTVAAPLTEEERVIENIDTVILSYGGVENNELYYALKGQVKELYAVGDCNGVRKTMWATNDGATVARQI